MIDRYWRPQDRQRKGWLVVGFKKGPGKTWPGFEYTLGVYNNPKLARLRAWLHTFRNPDRAARCELKTD